MKQKTLVCGLFWGLLIFQLIQIFPVYSPNELEYETEILYCNHFTWEKGQGQHTAGGSPYLQNDRDTWVKIWHESGWNIGYAFFEYENTTFSDAEIQYVRFHVECIKDSDEKANFTLKMIRREPSFVMDYFYRVWDHWVYHWVILNITDLMPDVFTKAQHINSFQLENLCKGTNGGLPDNAEWGGRIKMTRSYLEVVSNIPIDYPLESPPLGDYIPIGYGLGGLAIFSMLPLFLLMLYRRDKKKFWSWIPYAFLLFLIALAFVIAWLWD